MTRGGASDVWSGVRSIIFSVMCFDTVRSAASNTITIAVIEIATRIILSFIVLIGLEQKNRKTKRATSQARFCCCVSFEELVSMFEAYPYYLVPTTVQLPGINYCFHDNHYCLVICHIENRFRSILRCSSLDRYVLQL